MSEPTTDLPIVHDAADIESVEQLVSALDRSGIRPILISERDFASRSGGPTWVLNEARAVMFAVAMPSPLDFLLKRAETVRSTPDGVQRPLFVALLREATERTAQALGADPGDVLDLRSGINDSVIAEFASRLRQRLDGPPPNVPDMAQMSKRGPLPNEPVSPPPNVPPETARTPPDVGVIWDALDDAARDALAQADAVAKRRSASQLHSEDLLIGLYREADGPTVHLLRGAGVSAREVAQMVAKQIPSIRPAARLRRVPPLEFAPTFSRHSYEALTKAFVDAQAEGPGGRITTRHLLAGLVSLEDCSVAEQLRAAGLTEDGVLAWRPPQPAGVPEALAGFRSDSTAGPDLLNIGPEVDAIATVLAARTVEPPLALGLFGDWGTGKTFFMDKLEHRIDDLANAEAGSARHGDERVYCRHIVQLRFNAWHYIDENLWASLANAIFEGLDEALANRELDDDVIEDRGKQRAGLILERAQAQQRLDAARERQAEADRRAADAQAEIDRVDGQIDELVAAIRPEQILASAARVATAQPEVAARIEEQRQKVQAEIETAAKKLDIEPETLRKELAATSDGGYLVAWRALLNEKGAARIWLPVAALALLAVVVSVALDAIGFDSAALVGAGVSLLVGVATGLRPFLEAGRTVSKVIVDARAEGQKLIDERREQLRAAAVQEKETRDAEAAAAAADVQAESDLVSGVDSRLAILRPGREMADFVRVRQSSNEYKSRLGIVARARDDFEELSRLLARDWADRDGSGLDAEATAHGEGEPAGPKPIERIILFIDDLDRVKEKEVVAVLQAVHLLLAFPLFVVVVAVDPRWLLHSLRVESNVLGADQQGLTDEEEDGFGWEATPLNYLEKIFQIPFALRPMGRSGFGAIIDNLVGATPGAAGTDGANGRDGTHVAAAIGDQPSRTDSGNGSRPQDAQLPEQEPPADGEGTPETQQVTTPPAPARSRFDEDRRPVEMNPRALDISEDERLFMAQMHPLIGTPRGAKRFVNVYRLLKASHPVDEQGQFADPTVHRPVLLLLACLTGFPRETAEILRALVEDEPDGLWWDFVNQFVKSAADEAATRDELRRASWEQFGAKLRLVRSRDTENMRCTDVRDRARRVARYSFESSRILFMEAEEPAQAAPRRTKPAATSKA